MTTPLPAPCPARAPLAVAGPVRTGLGGLCRTPLVRTVVVLLLVLGQCPAFAAGLIMAASTGGEHDASCNFGTGEIKVTLAHHRAATPHRHTLAERLLIASSDTPNQPDHRFALAREGTFTLFEAPRLPHPTAVPAPSLLIGHGTETCLSRSGRFAPAPRPPSLPETHSSLGLRRGIVMRR